MSNPPRQAAFKAAHRKALARLAKQYPPEYKLLRTLVKMNEPNASGDAITRKARAGLAKAFPEEFVEFYNEEKSVFDLPPVEDISLTIKADVVKLFEDANGRITIANMAEQLSAKYETYVSYERVAKILQRAGLKIKMGPKGKNK